MQNLFFWYLKGIAMGAADVVPGVSGGTIAFLTGIYARLLKAIESLSLPTLRLLLKGHVKAFFKKIDFVFLFCVLAGIATSIVSLAKLFSYLLETYPILTMSFFFGLIMATVWVVGKQIKRWDTLTVTWFVLGTAAAIGISFASQGSGSANPFYLFLCGFVAVCSMILPGISGSFVLLLLGNYALVIGAIGELPTTLKSLDTNQLIEIFSILLPFALGALTGLLSFAKLLSWLFTKFENNLLAVLTGFVLGSLSIIYPWKKILKTETMPNGKVKVIETMRYLPELNQEFWMALALMLFGCLLVLSIEYFGSKKAN